MRKTSKLLCVALVFCFILSLSITANGAAKTIPLKFIFIGTSDVERNWCQSITKEFNNTHKNIVVTPEYIPQTEVMMKMLAMCKAGTPPDMAWLSATVQGSDLQGMGLLTDIDKYVRKWAELKHFYKSALDLVSYNNKLYTIPTMVQVNIEGGHYRVDKLKTLTGGDGTAIKTWNDWLNILKQCHNKDMNGDGKIDTYGLGLDIYNVNTFVQSMARNNGNLKLSDILDNTKKKQWLEIFNMLHALSKFNIYGIDGMNYKDLQRAFAEDLIVFLPHVSSWGFGNIYPINPSIFTADNIGLLVGPVGPSHQGAALPGALVYGPFVFKGIPESHVAASAEFIKFQANKQNSARFPGFMHTPARDDITVDAVMKYSPYTKAQYGWYLEKWLQLVKTAQPIEKLPNANELKQEMADLYLDLKDDKITPEAAYEKYREAAKKSWPNWPKL